MREQKSANLLLFNQSGRFAYLAELQRKIGSANVVMDEKLLRWSHSEKVYYQGTIYARHINPDRSIGGMVAQDAVINPLAVVSAGAIVHSRVEIGSGSEICMRVIIYSEAHIGRHVKIMNNSIIGFGTKIHDGAFLGPNVSVANGVIIGAYANLGAYTSVHRGAIVKDGELVGQNSLIMGLRQ